MNLVTPQLVKYCESMQTIVICGFTKTGKVLIAKKLAEQLNRPLIISDDYKFEEYEYFRNTVLNLYNKKIPFIAEGVLCFRLLRKGVQENNFYPNLILKTVCNEATIRYFYNKDGEADKIHRVLGFNKSLSTIWNEYINYPNISIPNIIELNTSLPNLR